MKRYLILALAALALAVVSQSSFATIRHVILDPTDLTLGVVVNSNNYFDCSTRTNPDAVCSVFDPGRTYTAAFQSCTNTGVSATYDNDSCLWFGNSTGARLASFTFSFVVPADDTTFDCAGQPANQITVVSCPTGTLKAGDSVTMMFNAIPPAIKAGQEFWLITDPMPEGATATGVVAVPEPGELGLFGLGLLAIGVGVAFRRRRAADLR